MSADIGEKDEAELTKGEAAFLLGGGYSFSGYLVDGVAGIRNLVGGIGLFLKE